MSGKATALGGVLLAEHVLDLLAIQIYCTGGIADWLHMGDVEECR